MPYQPFEHARRASMPGSVSPTKIPRPFRRSSPKRESGRAISGRTGDRRSRGGSHGACSAGYGRHCHPSRTHRVSAPFLHQPEKHQAAARSRDVAATPKQGRAVKKPMTWWHGHKREVCLVAATAMACFAIFKHKPAVSGTSGDRVRLFEELHKTDPSNSAIDRRGRVARRDRRPVGGISYYGQR